MILQNQAGNRTIIADYLGFARQTSPLPFFQLLKRFEMKVVCYIKGWQLT
jgi:hypothetical protein